MFYWTAFDDLQSESERGRVVRWTALERYASRYGFEVDELKRIVWTLQRKTITFWKNAHDRTGDSPST